MTQAMATVAGDNQTGPAGVALPVAPAVKVTNAAGAPVSGLSIAFSVPPGSGSITGATATTGADGIATVGSWTIAQAAGTNHLSATAAGTVTGSPASFTATGTAGPAAAAVKSLGDAQQAPAGQLVSIPPAVNVRDQFANPVSGVRVTFAVASGGGSITGESQTTGTNGMATLGGWRLGNAPGANSLTATVATGTVTGSPATFTATGVVGAPALIAKTAGDNQSAVAGTAVLVPPTVRVTDAVGNNVNGAGVTFSVATGGGAVTGATQLTAADGTTRPTQWTLGPTAGSNMLTAATSASGVSGSPLTFVATGTAGLNAQLYAGTWSGTWTNSTFGSSGTTSLIIALGAAANQVTITHSGTGTVLGGSGAPAETRTNVPYTPAAFTLQTVSTTFGNVTLNVDASGAVTGSGTQVPNAAVSRWDCTGTITPTQIRLTFTVTFAAGGSATGSISINKQ